MSAAGAEQLPFTGLLPYFNPVSKIQDAIFFFFKKMIILLRYFYFFSNSLHMKTPCSSLKVHINSYCYQGP